MKPGHRSLSWTRSAVIVFLVIGLTNCQVLNVSDCSAARDGATENRSQLFNFMTKGITNQLWDKLPSVLRQGQGSQVSTKCAKALLTIVQGTQDGRLWAYRFMDASAKSPAGLLEGTISSLGDYDECLDIKHNDDRHFSGQYCMLKLLTSDDLVDDGSEVSQKLRMFPMFGEFPLNYALCMPSACSAQEVATVVSLTTEDTYVRQNATPICDSRESIAFSFDKMTKPQIFSLVYIVAMVTIVYWSTVMDIYGLFQDGYRQSKWSTYLRLFSGNFNTYKLMQYKSTGRLSVVDDIRYIFAISTAAIHSYACAIEYRAIMKISRLEEDFQNKFYSFWAQPFFNVIGIEAFFCIGGLTAMMSLYHIIEKGTTVGGTLKAILYRWLRFGPAIISLLAIDLVWPLFGSGPLFTELTSTIVDNCSKNWWKNFLMINNYDDVSDLCLAHTWYIAAEFQLFVIGVAAVCLIRLSPKLGLSFCYLMVILGMVIPGAKAYIYNYPPTFIMGFARISDVNTFITQMYFPTYCHLSPYFIGVLVGYYLKTDAFNMKVTTLKRVCGCMFYTFFTSILFAPAYWNTFKNPIEPMTSAIFSVTHRVLWTFGFLSLIMFTKEIGDNLFKSKKKEDTFLNNNVQNGTNDVNSSPAVQTGSGGASVTRKESSVSGFRTTPQMKQFMVVMMKCIGKLYFSLYLVHSAYIRYDWFRARELREFNAWNTSIRGTYSVLSSLILAFYFHIVFEAPLENVRRYFKDGAHKPSLVKVKSS